MPTLNDYIGGLVSSITNARVMSDIQTVRVAEEYAKDNLLKHFSIPRMRIDDIELTIPIALDNIQEKTQTTYEPINVKRFNSVAYREVLNNLGVSKVPPEVAGIIQSEIASKSQYLDQSVRFSKNMDPIKAFAENISMFSAKVMETYSLAKKINMEGMQKKLAESLTQEIEIIEEKKELAEMNVIVESQKLREYKPENIIFLKLKISEEGMEWNHSENNNGETTSKLISE